MAKGKWHAQEHHTADKRFEVYGPSSFDGGLLLYVDYDDVNHDLVEEELEKMLEILNKHWPH